MSILLSLLIYFQRQSSLYCQKMGEKYQQDHVVNFNDKHSYVVGIPVSPSTLYVDHPLDNRAVQPPNELGIRRKNTTSFQITSVTVQGSRLNNEDFEDSADDFDESHTDDISSDILDSSRITEPDGYQSEDTCNTNCEDMSPCGPIIIAQLPSNNNESSINLGLGIGMSPTFSPMVSSGVTMMTSSSESPVNTQVPMINPLPDNWQHRFKVVKIVSSEPFKRGRWVCMDFVDPPTHSHNSNEKCDVPSIHVTSCNSNTQGSQHLNVGSAVAHVFEIPMNQSYPGVPSLNSQQNSQQFYGIILPQNSNPYQSINQVTLVQNVGSQTADYTNLNHLPELQNQNSQHQARTYSQLDNFLHNQINISTPASMPSMSMNQPRVITSNNMMDNVRSVSSANGHNSSFSVPNQVSFPVNISNSVDIQSNSVALNAVTVPPDKHTTASRSSMQNEDSERNKWSKKVVPVLHHSSPTVTPWAGHPQF